MKDITLRNRIWVKPRDQMDVWLDTQGFYRKHTARDGTCLFRAVSEQIFFTQSCHLEVRNQILDYMLRHANIFQKMITCPLSEYIEKMRNPREWGGKIEIEAMALMYRHDFILYQEIGNAPESVTQFGFENKVLLCYSQERHYDSVYTKDYISSAALCQSLIYDLLYKNVFELKEVDYAVNKMLHDKTSRYQRDHISLLNTGFENIFEFALRFEMRDSYLNVKELLDIGITPFPYKVAKSLDPEVYRNVEYDTWNDYRKGLRYGLYVWNCHELQIGVKCLVKINDTSYHGHIQDMQPNKGPVIVFIEELGEKMTVSYDCLELLPPPPQTTSPPARTTLPFKIQSLPVPLPKPGKRIIKCTGTRTKGKDGENGKNIKCHKEHATDCASPQTSVITSSDYYEQDIEYQQEAMDTYQQSFTPQRNDGPISSQDEQVGPDSTKPGLEGAQIPITIPLEPCHYPSYTVSGPIPQPQINVPIPDSTNSIFQSTPVPVNLMAPKSLNTDGSDLPHSDIPTLRFFYNLGLDHLRMNCVLRPGPPCYLNPGVLPPGYVAIDNSNIPPYDQPGIASTSESRRNEFLQPTRSSENSTNQMVVPISPRFKNKFKQCINVKRNSSIYEGPPLIQQCEVSSTTNMGVGMGIPVSPVYYPPVECEPYCMTVPYIDYGSYDYSPVYPQVPHAYSPASYITPEGLIYQHVLPPGIVPTSPQL